MTAHDLVSPGAELDSHRVGAGQAFTDIPKCQAEDTLTAQDSFQDKTAFMIQCYLSSLCNSAARAVIPPSLCMCNNDRCRRTSQFLSGWKLECSHRGFLVQAVAEIKLEKCL